MRVLLITVGSRGDAEPFCSLAASLALSDAVDRVDLFLQRDLIHLAPTEGDDRYGKKIRCHELPFTQMDFYKYAGERKPPMAGAGHPNPRVVFVGIVTDCMGKLVLPCYDQVLAVARGEDGDGSAVDAVVASSLSRQIAIQVAGRLGKKIPLYLIQLQPLVPTRDYPHYSRAEDCAKAIARRKRTAPNTAGGDDDAADAETGGAAAANLDSYVELERHQHEFLRVHLADRCRERDDFEEFHVDFDSDLLPALMGIETPSLDIWMVNAVSTHIVPPGSDSGKKVLHVGGLADGYIPADFSPPEGLVDFLERVGGSDDSACGDSRPICFGYGSMPFGGVEVLLEALFEAKRPAVLVGSAMMTATDKITNGDDNGEAESAWLKDNVYCVPAVQYAWLLPRCCMMFSHGGAGVVHATLRAGIPAVISPLMGDQFFYASLLEAQGLGATASKTLGSLTKDDILRSIEEAEKCSAACRKLGLAMKTGEPAGGGDSKLSGAENLVHAIVSGSNN